MVKFPGIKNKIKYRKDILLMKQTFGEKVKAAFSMFWYFFKISWFTFGGGWSIVAQMQKDFVDGKQVLTSEELLDIVSVGRSLPGTMIGNVAYLFGYRQAGVLGGVLAVIGMITPPMLILGILTYGYAAFKDNKWVAKALVGVRASVVPIIAVAGLKLREGAFPRKACYIICIGACLLNAIWNVNCILIILVSMVLGLILEKWEGKKNA